MWLVCGCRALPGGREPPSRPGGLAGPALGSQDRSTCSSQILGLICSLWNHQEGARIQIQAVQTRFPRRVCRGASTPRPEAARASRRQVWGPCTRSSQHSCASVRPTCGGSCSTSSGEKSPAKGRPAAQWVEHPTLGLGPEPDLVALETQPRVLVLEPCTPREPALTFAPSTPSHARSLSLSPKYK